MRTTCLELRFSDACDAFLEPLFEFQPAWILRNCTNLNFRFGHLLPCFISLRDENLLNYDYNSRWSLDCLNNLRREK